MVRCSISLLVTAQILSVVAAAPFEFLIHFDNYPGEISYELRKESQLIASNGTFDDYTWNNKVYRSEKFELEIGQDYEVTVFDTYGDGLGEPSGWFAVHWGGTSSGTEEDTLFQIDDFTSGYQRVVPFKSQRPSTDPPTSSPAPTLSMAPTFSPTTCREDKDNWEALWPIIGTESSTVHFKSADTVWPETNRFCVQHTTYAGCVNEGREDCQWTWRSASEANGNCRVDPVAKCIQNDNCVCNTEDFQGGGANLGEGILFHAPISITAGDVTPNKHSVIYKESWSRPSNDHPKHPQRDDFFISRVDFTGRQYQYSFLNGSPVRALGGGDATVLFKLHHLYYDVPMVGSLFSGLGMDITIDTSNSNDAITINGLRYVLGPALRLQSRPLTCLWVEARSNEIWNLRMVLLLPRQT